MTNIRNPWTRPLYVEARIVGTGLEEGIEPKDCLKNSSQCRSCAGTAYVTSTRQDWFPDKTTE